MNNFLMTLLLAVSAFAANAQTCKDTAAYEPARKIIADLGRIETPNGVQESYKVRLNGIDQWVNVRGQDRANPVVLFVHGGPASPLTPTLWQFQRPLEEYFTMVTYGQRGAGKTCVTNDAAKVADTVHIPNFVDDVIAMA